MLPTCFAHVFCNAAGEMRVNVSSCVTPTSFAPSARSEAVHVWSKPLPNGTLAVLLIADHWQALPSVQLELSWLGLGSVSRQPFSRELGCSMCRRF